MLKPCDYLVCVGEGGAPELKTVEIDRLSLFQVLI